MPCPSPSPDRNKSIRRPSSALPKWSFAEALAELERKEVEEARKKSNAPDDANTTTVDSHTHTKPEPRPFFSAAPCTAADCPLNERRITHAPGPYQHNDQFWAGQLRSARQGEREGGGGGGGEGEAESRFRFCNPPPFVWVHEKLFDFTLDEMERFRDEGRMGALAEVGKVNSLAADVVGRFLELHGGLGG